MPVEPREETDKRERAASATQTTQTLTQRQMLGLFSKAGVGALSLTLTAPKIRDLERFEELMFDNWPDLLLIAAQDASGFGIDPGQVAGIWSVQRVFQRASIETTLAGLKDDDDSQKQRAALEALLSRIPESEVTPSDATRASREMGQELARCAGFLKKEDWDALKGSVLWGMADVLQLMGGGPGYLWPREQATTEDLPGGHAECPDGLRWLDDALLDLSVGELADLTRQMYAILGGFEGDIAERFTRG